MGVGGQRHAPTAFTPGKDPVPIVQEAGWAPGPVWTGAENLAPTGIRSPDRPTRSESLYRLMRRQFWTVGPFCCWPSLDTVAKINFPFCTASSTSYQRLHCWKESGLSVNFTTFLPLESKQRISGCKLDMPEYFCKACCLVQCRDYLNLLLHIMPTSKQNPHIEYGV